MCNEILKSGAKGIFRVVAFYQYQNVRITTWNGQIGNFELQY